MSEVREGVTVRYAKPGYKWVLGDCWYTEEESREIQRRYDARVATRDVGDQRAKEVIREFIARQKEERTKPTPRAVDCPVCGQSFLSTSVHRLYCSRRCREKAERRVVIREVACPVCGETFTTANPRKTYCSTRCCRKASREARRRETACAICGTVFTVERARKKYCSDACRSVAEHEQNIRKAQKLAKKREAERVAALKEGAVRHVCVECRRPFVADHLTARFCSETCEGRNRVRRLEMMKEVAS